MRPVEKGACPTIPDPSDPSQQIAKVFTDYKQARPYLIDRIGEFCSYCNSKIPASLAVEHVVPKDPRPALALDWDNFLLACTNCNSTKKDTIDIPFYQPDLHNTHLPFEYFDDGRVEISTQITDPIRYEIAQNTLDLVGLQKYEENDIASDRRCKHRQQSFRYANNALATWEVPNPSPNLLITIIDLAYTTGHFSIWYKVFENHPDVLRALIQRFEGTDAANAFNVHCQPIKRTPLM